MEEQRTKIEELKIKRSEVLPSREEIQEALEHHLRQLRKSGATLEDSVCQVLRKFLEVEELDREIERRTTLQDENKLE